MNAKVGDNNNGYERIMGKHGVGTVNNIVWWLLSGEQPGR